MTETLRAFHNSGEVNLEVENKDGVMQAIFEHYREQATAYTDLDGHRFEFGSDWWFIIRPSNTEPVLRLTVEATSEALLHEKVEEIQRLL